jgi:hypothetical protein
LYEKYKEDKNLSFFFSDESDDEKTDEEIIKQVANLLFVSREDLSQTWKQIKSSFTYEESYLKLS